MKALERRIAALPAVDAGPDYVVKRLSTHEFVSLLPKPADYTPHMGIPDVPVLVTLSTGVAAPVFIQEMVAHTKDQLVFGGNGLAGLCLNRLNPVPSIFVHAGLLAHEDPSGDDFEEYAWHEFVHACEGLEGADAREVPISYRTRDLMLNFDEAAGHVPVAGMERDDPAAAFQYTMYLREGTVLQGHACEMFARVAVLDHLIIRETGQALMPEAFEREVRMPGDMGGNASFQFNRWGLAVGLQSYSPPAQAFFWHMLPMALGQSRMLYGVRPDGIRLPEFTFRP